MTAKGVLRTVKNYTKGYSDMQMKVREATSNDPGGPSGALMSQIAQATFSQHEFLEVMEMIDKRLNDKGKNWRHVFKALTLLDYCLHVGSDQVVQYALDNIYIVKTLREFQHIDDSGRDQGANVRQKAKEVTILLLDPARLREERKNRNWMNGRMGFNEAASDFHGAHNYSGGRSPYAPSRNRSNVSHGRRNSFSNPDYRYGDDDKEMREAMAASRREATSRAVPKGYDEDAELKRAIEESARVARDEENKRRSQAGASSSKAQAQGASTAGEVDLIGGMDDAFSTTPQANGGNSMAGFGDAGFGNSGFGDAFGQQPVATSAGSDLLGAFGGSNMNAANQFGGMNNLNSANSGAFDPFGLSSAGNSAAINAGMGMNMGTGMDMNMNMGANNPYGASGFGTNANHFVSQPNLAANAGIGGTMAGISNPFGQNGSTLSPQTSAFGANPNAQSSNAIDLLGSSSMAGSTTASAAGFGSAGGFDGASGAFGSAFDGGMSAKPLPFGVNPNDPNSKLAEIARNSEKIDPFASLAMGSASSQGNPFGAPTPGLANTSQNVTATPSLIGISSAQPNLTTGGSSLVDLSPAALASSTATASFSSFGQVNRNPFATGSSGPSLSGKQPSLNQLMSSTGASSQMQNANAFGQQLQSPNMMGGLGNMQAQAQQFQQQQQQLQQQQQFQQQQQLQQQQLQQQQFQQQQQINPFSQGGGAINNQNNNFFGL
ncbi:hypothetical protein GGI12_000086 [Dipsacomyces acuminosporus]|nr:hypothetical protein GGI12_000086 [Dipsacomyces acuminosporus]